MARDAHAVSLVRAGPSEARESSQSKKCLISSHSVSLRLWQPRACRGAAAGNHGRGRHRWPRKGRVSAISHRWTGWASAPSFPRF